MTRVATQLGRMRVPVDELALPARLDRDRPLELQPLDLAALTADVVDDVRVMDPDRTVTFSGLQAATVLGDGPKLQQAVVNVLANAVQHTPPGTPVDVSIDRPRARHPRAGPAPCVWTVLPATAAGTATPEVQVWASPSWLHRRGPRRGRRR